MAKTDSLVFFQHLRVIRGGLSEVSSGIDDDTSARQLALGPINGGKIQWIKSANTK